MKLMAKLVHDSEMEIPLDKLGQDNPIQQYGEVALFEDELGDKGYSKVSVRFRAMKDCFFVLLRAYTRVDHVLVRILDTRIYCSQCEDVEGKVEIIRDFTFRESTYADLKAKGFTFGSEWGLSPSQSDEVYPHLTLVSKYIDKIVLE
jgi:type 2A phosphatase activator TIP41